MALHAHPLGSLERYGREPRRLEPTGCLGSRSARRADAAGPFLHPSCRLVHTAADRPWPGHTSPEYPPMHAPPRPPCAAVDGPRPPAAWRRWRLTAGSPPGPWVRGRAMTRVGTSHERVWTSEPRVGEERVHSRHPGKAPGLLHGRAGRPREAQTTGELVGL